MQSHTAYFTLLANVDLVNEIIIGNSLHSICLDKLVFYKTLVQCNGDKNKLVSNYKNRIKRGGEKTQTKEELALLSTILACSYDNDALLWVVEMERGVIQRDETLTEDERSIQLNRLPQVAQDIVGKYSGLAPKRHFSVFCQNLLRDVKVYMKQENGLHVFYGEESEGEKYRKML